jgi:hypothetical protein
VNDTRWPRGLPYKSTLPKQGSIYTVRAIAERKSPGYDEDGLLLAEIVNPTFVFQFANLSTQVRSRISHEPLPTGSPPTNIDVFTKMLEAGAGA